MLQKTHLVGVLFEVTASFITSHRYGHETILGRGPYARFICYKECKSYDVCKIAMAQAASD